MTPEEIIRSQMLKMALKSSMVAAYEWKPDFCVQECREAWQNAKATMNTPFQTLTVKDLQSVPRHKLYEFGFGNWDGDLVVIPLYAFNLIADGETLISISGSRATKGIDDIDTDVRFGCIAYGFKYDTNE